MDNYIPNSTSKVSRSRGNSILSMSNKGDRGKSGLVCRFCALNLRQQTRRQQTSTTTNISINIGINMKIIPRYGLERGVDEIATVVDGEAMVVGAIIKRCLL